MARRRGARIPMDIAIPATIVEPARFPAVAGAR